MSRLAAENAIERYEKSSLQHTRITSDHNLEQCSKNRITGHRNIARETDDSGEVSYGRYSSRLRRTLAAILCLETL